jgi:hypothetical protein
VAETARFGICILRGRTNPVVQRGKDTGLKTATTNSLFADIFVPDRWITRNVVCEQLDAFVRVGIEDFGPVFAEPFDAALKIHRLADDYSADAELADEAAAIPTGGEGGHHDFVAVGALAAGFAESIGLAVDGGIAFLDPAIVAAPQEFSFAIEERGADGDSAFGEAEEGLFDGHL